MSEPQTEHLLDETFAVISFITYLHSMKKIDNTSLNEIIHVCERLKNG